MTGGGLKNINGRKAIMEPRTLTLLVPVKWHSRPAWICGRRLIQSGLTARRGLAYDASTDTSRLNERPPMKLREFTVIVASVLVLAVGIVLSPGCKTAGVYDPDKTQKVEAIITPFMTEGISLVFQNNPDKKVELGNYFRAFGSIFQDMVNTKNFSPTALVKAANALTEQFGDDIPPAALTAKNGVVALYRALYAGQVDAELSEDRAPIHVARVIAEGVDQALKDARLPGLQD